MQQFPISWLHTQAYCEYQLKLQYVDKKIGEYSAAMTQGSFAHDKLEKDFLKTAKPLKEPLEDYLAKLLLGKAKPITMREITVKSKAHNIVGRVDEAQLYPDTALIIDDKPGEKAYMSNKKQVWAYCLAFKEQYQWPKTTVAVLRNRDTQDVFWEKEFTQQDEEFVVESINRVHGLFAGEIEWIPTKFPNKCENCSFNKACDKALC